MITIDLTATVGVRQFAPLILALLDAPQFRMFRTRRGRLALTIPIAIFEKIVDDFAPIVINGADGLVVLKY